MSNDENVLWQENERLENELRRSQGEAKHWNRQWRRIRNDFAGLFQDYARVTQSADAMADRIESLHVRHQGFRTDKCKLCRESWPCQTVQALYPIYTKDKS